MKLNDFLKDVEAGKAPDAAAVELSTLTQTEVKSAISTVLRLIAKELKAGGAK